MLSCICANVLQLKLKLSPLLGFHNISTANDETISLKCLTIITRLPNYLHHIVLRFVQVDPCWCGLRNITELRQMNFKNSFVVAG